MVWQQGCDDDRKLHKTSCSNKLQNSEGRGLRIFHQRWWGNCFVSEVKCKLKEKIHHSFADMQKNTLILMPNLNTTRLALHCSYRVWWMLLMKFLTLSHAVARFHSQHSRAWRAYEAAHGDVDVSHPGLVALEAVFVDSRLGELADLARAYLLVVPVLSVRHASSGAL